MRELSFEVDILFCVKFFLLLVCLVLVSLMVYTNSFHWTNYINFMIILILLGLEIVFLLRNQKKGNFKKEKNPRNNTDGLSEERKKTFYENDGNDIIF